MYLATSTRPDISCTMGCLARFSSNPGTAHEAALKHLFCYLQGTKDLVYNGNVDEGEPFPTYTDADHGGEPISEFNCTAQSFLKPVDNGHGTSEESKVIHMRSKE